ncbi:MAG: cytochrome c3 family protein [Thermodesulfobacteriota bacterium]
MKKAFLFIQLISVFLLSNIVLGRIGGGDISFKSGKARDVIFSHDTHVSDIGFKCTDCHDGLYTTKEKHRKVTMADMRKGSSCGACHNGKRAFDVRANCSNCHKKD